MSALLKFRFRWRANGEEDSIVIEAPDYPTACYHLGRSHFIDMALEDGKSPSDFRIDLTKPERVE